MNPRLNFNEDCGFHVCTKCEAVKASNDFYVSGDGTRMKQCIQCRLTYQKQMEEHDATAEEMSDLRM